VINKCLIIGLGQIGMGYDLANNSEHFVYTHAKAFSIHPQFDLVGAVDPSKTKRDVFKKHYNLPVFSEIFEALQKEKPNVIVIAVPTASHLSVIKEVLTHVKPDLILCEKPLAYDLVEANSIVQMCKIADVKLVVNYIRRADPGVIEIKERIRSGQILEPIKGVVWYSKGFLHNGSHFFNLLEFWLGPFIRGKIIDAGRPLNDQDSEPDLQIEFKHGKVLFIAAWEEDFSHYTIELLSPSGRLRYEQEGESIFWQSTQDHPTIEGYKVLKIDSEVISNDMNRYQWNIVNQLAIALLDKQHNLSTGIQSLETLQAMHQLINKR
jgi:predicted dehydrogenase